MADKQSFSDIPDNEIPQKGRPPSDYSKTEVSKTEPFLVNRNIGQPIESKKVSSRKRRLRKRTKKESPEIRQGVELNEMATRASTGETPQVSRTETELSVGKKHGASELPDNEVAIKGAPPEDYSKVDQSKTERFIVIEKDVGRPRRSEQRSPGKRRSKKRSQKKLPESHQRVNLSEIAIRNKTGETAKYSVTETHLSTTQEPKLDEVDGNEVAIKEEVPVGYSKAEESKTERLTLNDEDVGRPKASGKRSDAKSSSKKRRKKSKSARRTTEFTQSDIAIKTDRPTGVEFSKTENVITTKLEKSFKGNELAQRMPNDCTFSKTEPLSDIQQPSKKTLKPSRKLKSRKSKRRSRSSKMRRKRDGSVKREKSARSRRFGIALGNEIALRSEIEGDISRTEIDIDDTVDKPDMILKQRRASVQQASPLMEQKESLDRWMLKICACLCVSILVAIYASVILFQSWRVSNAAVAAYEASVDDCETANALCNRYGISCFSHCGASRSQIFWHKLFG